MNALKEGQEVVESLREKASVEDFERILEQQEETQAQEDELRQMMQDVGIDDQEVMDDIDQLEAELFGGDIEKADVPNGDIEGLRDRKNDIISFQGVSGKNIKNDDEQVSDEQEKPEKVTNKRKKVVA
jgi:hypothetical protein